MATKTFSGRVDAEKFLLADAFVRQELGVSFGQYCSGALVDYICETGSLPDTRVKQERKGKGVSKMLSLARAHAKSDMSALSDREIKDMLAARYE